MSAHLPRITQTAYKKRVLSNKLGKQRKPTGEPGDRTECFDTTVRTHQTSCATHRQAPRSTFDVIAHANSQNKWGDKPMMVFDCPSPMETWGAKCAACRACADATVGSTTLALAKKSMYLTRSACVCGHSMVMVAHPGRGAAEHAWATTLSRRYLAQLSPAPRRWWEVKPDATECNLAVGKSPCGLGCASGPTSAKTEQMSPAQQEPD